MRIGINPEKQKSVKLLYKYHRVIIPVFIPETDNKYYQEAASVFKNCLESLIKTVDLNNTAISILNNNSNPEIENLIEYYYDEKIIDKYVKFSENKGKVYAILQEARASYENFITIADADVFFYNDWQLETHKVFKKFKNVGVVGLTPDPNLAFYCNNSLFCSQIFHVKKGKVVDDFDLELFEKSIGNNHFFKTEKKDWKKNQYYLEKGNMQVVVGANHFASTYRREIFSKLPFDKPIHVFPGGELKYLDIPIDKLGYHRVSLLKAYAYHMGNTIDQNVNLKNLRKNILHDSKNKYSKKKVSFVPYLVKGFFVGIIRKLSLI